MKRSRAVMLLTAGLQHLGLTNSPDYDVYDPPTLEQGEKLLDIIEQSIGMIPPSNGLLTINYTDMGISPSHEWEPENE